MLPVKLPVLLAWTLLVLLAFGALWWLVSAGTAPGKTAEDLESLIPPEVRSSLSPAVIASIRLASLAEIERRERFRKALLRLQTGYLKDSGNPLSRQAYLSALLELLGEHTL
ncbi:MAG: hypothetical protein HY692_09320 [Cyanobacteria bacterium NC_groundwater_1444_Ag_S-0.65um_54_12]|nr:hypothetical protein [Cyanobacteria bacterium NC_groundwater_1444_Ag_S-0.65um_54_12]